MAVRARVFVQSVKESAGQPDAREIEMRAVTRGDEAREWSKWTPSAHFVMHVSNPAALPLFRPGAELMVTFEEAPANTTGAP